jgi:hypothetical protein
MKGFREPTDATQQNADVDHTGLGRSRLRSAILSVGLW